MKDQYIKLIKSQIDKLDSKNFDLDSWKDSTILVLERIYGIDSEKIARIKNIHYDMSSWSLRDTLGTSAHFDTCKKKGKEILEVCIMEIETVGIPEETEREKKQAVKTLLPALEDELTITQFRELEKLIAETDTEKREKSIHEFLNKLGMDRSVKILTKILGSLQID